MLDALVARYLTFWGKARSEAHAVVLYHPAVYHMIDVMCVFEKLFDDYRPTWLDPRFKNLLLFLVALHDVGKMTRAFQQIAPEVWPEDIFGPFQAVAAGQRHDTLGYKIMLSGYFRTELEKLRPGSRFSRHWLPLVRATTGHHGRPPQIMPQTIGFPEECCRDSQMAIAKLVIDLKALLGIDDASFAVENSAADAAMVADMQWWFAGMVNLADWIGSKKAWFDYHAPTLSLTDYRDVARARAEEAVLAAGIKPALSNQLMAFQDLFGFENPSPLQQWCRDVPLPTGPKLLILEDETGNGKTEGYMMLSHRMMVGGEANGVFCCLPTMATSNAMYGRFSKVYRRLFAPYSTPSLALNSSRRLLNDGFRDSIASTMGAQIDPSSLQAECAAWIASDNRRAFLADVGVGTIDQALMSVMPTKFAPLRLLGLSRKVLVVDEAHAYDTYMLGLLKTLLTFHARAGGSAIILSATLPLATRRELAAAFAAGLRVAPPHLKAMGYPLATMISCEGVVEEADGLRSVEPRKRGKTASVEVIGSFESVIDEIESAAQKGAAVVWVRNTVADALEAYRLLRQRGMEKVTLFHSRFTSGDRSIVEDSVMEAFGKNGPLERRRGHVLIATQVVEQSLDLDFDLMVSDPAPMDLLVQRAGRLWRHLRADRPLAYPRLLVCAPPVSDEPAADWLGLMDKGDTGLSITRTAYVYRDLSLVWRSLRIVQREGEIGTGTNLRDMVEAAYEEEAFSRYGACFTPEALGRSAAAAGQRDIVSASKAVAATLDLNKGYAGENWVTEMAVRTRLSRPSISIRLGLVRGNGMVPITVSDSPFRWAASEVSCSNTELGCFQSADERLIEAEKVGWSASDKAIPLIPMRENDAGDFVAEVVCLLKDGRKRRLSVKYSRTTGMEISAFR